LSESLPRFRYASRRVGALILIALGIFVVAVLEAGVVQDLFKSTRSLRVILPDAGLAGLNAGARVEILGTDAGQVRQIVIDPKQRFHAVAEIEQAMEPFVRRDSKVFIRKQFGIAGAAYLEITRGQGEPLDWEYAVLTAEADEAPTENIGAVIKEVRAKVLPILDELHRTVAASGDLVAELRSPEGRLQQALADLDTVTSRLAEGKGSVGRLLADDALARNLEATSSEVAATSQVIGAQSQNVPAMIASARTALASLNQIMAKVDRTMPELTGLVRETSSASIALPTLLTQTHRTLAELERLLVQLQRHWLLGGANGAAAPKPSRLSPVEARP
jgi:phospholipid/cholesterol/gamma-HCH transport system substrate-binding protein